MENTKGQTPSKKQIKYCVWCGAPFQEYKEKRFCGTSCSAKWRMSQPEIRAKVYTQECKIKAMETRLKTWVGSEAYIQHCKNSSERMKKSNPMTSKKTREKMRATKEKNGTLHVWNGGPIGGNGRGLTKQQAILFAKLGDGWEVEYIIPTKTLKQKYSAPNHYKIDIAHPQKKIAVEIQGNTHHWEKIKERDVRKKLFLEQLGWTVFIFWNKEVEQNLNGIVKTILSTI